MFLTKLQILAVYESSILESPCLREAKKENTIVEEAEKIDIQCADNRLLCICLR